MPTWDEQKRAVGLGMGDTGDRSYVWVHKPEKAWERKCAHKLFLGGV